MRRVWRNDRTRVGDGRRCQAQPFVAVICHCVDQAVEVIVTNIRRLQRQRQRRTFRVRNRLKADASRPRLSVFRSHKHIYAQIIDDSAGRTLAAASTLDKHLRGQITYGGNKAAAAMVGKLLAERALQNGIKAVSYTHLTLPTIYSV